MTVKEKLLQEFECAINSTYGDQAEEDVEDVEITSADIKEIARKTEWQING